MARRAGNGLSVLLLALSSSALTPTATAGTHRAAAPSGVYCGPQEGFYGKDRWTYADVLVCLHFEGGPEGELKVNTHNNTYFWGGAWYSASITNRAKWEVDGTVSKGGQTDGYHVGAFQAARDGYAPGRHLPVLKECGTYQVTMKFHQNGAHWLDPEWDIKSGVRTYQIDVPCKG
ncbi:hypothetical protein O1M63_28950 [Streptomyces mirabilis]|nr:hypothetical protein [Streptomyces mirabilis]